MQLVDILVFLVFCEFKNKQWGILLSIGVLLHWFIDAMVHVGDMPIFHDSIKVGLGLWQFPWLAYLLELAVFIVAGYFLLRNYNNVKRHIILIVLLSAGLSSMFFAPEAEVSTDVVSITSLSLYVISALFAYWSER